MSPTNLTLPEIPLFGVSKSTIFDNFGHFHGDWIGVGNCSDRTVLSVNPVEGPEKPVKIDNFPKIDRLRGWNFTILTKLTILTVLGRFLTFFDVFQRSVLTKNPISFRGPF